jgi:putative nucleotidyltransferase with HDIG domain
MSVRPLELIAELRSEPATAAVLSRLARRPCIDSHNESVAVIAVDIARELGVDDLRHVARAGLLHDVGKQLVAREILDKPGALTAGEWAIVRRHAEHGHRILVAAGLPREALIALHHHERWDGTGYPHGLAGEAIPLVARILAVADTYDAMTSARPYRAPLAHDRAVAELARVSGSQLDPACVAAFAAAPLSVAA